jgi:CRISPR-associated protein Csb1
MMMSNSNLATARKTTAAEFLAANGPACLIVKAQFEPLGDQDRFQPAGFPEMGHVIYDAPRANGEGHPITPDRVCIVDSAASMANHLETLCFANSFTSILHEDLTGLPYVRCVTEPKNRLVVTTLSEGHRLASDYFLDSRLDGKKFREVLRAAFGITEVKKDKTYFIAPDDWWTIYETIFQYDPNSLVHGILFAREQIKISRLLTAHLEAFGAARVGSAGVKFDRLGKTISGQPIFSKDEETAQRIEATFLLDLGLLRSYGHDGHGLTDKQKRLLLELSLWKIQRMLNAPFRFRSGCHLRCVGSSYATENGAVPFDASSFGLNISAAIKDCNFGAKAVTDVHYPATELYKVESDSSSKTENETETDDEKESTR